MSPPPFTADSGRSPQKGRTYVHVVCSPQGHVGTTLTARLLTDFLISQTGGAVGFDTNHLDPQLASIFPREVKIVDLSSTRDQMTLFDSLIEDDGVPKVVDLWHVSFDRFFKQADDIGFFPEAKRRDLKCFVLLQMDPKGRFAQELDKLRNRCPGADVILVENAWLSGLAAEPDASASLTFDRRRLFVPKLSPTIHSFLQHSEVLICRFVDMRVPNDLRALQDQFRDSLLPIFNQFEIFETAAELGLTARSLLSRKHTLKAKIDGSRSKL